MTPSDDNNGNAGPPPTRALAAEPEREPEPGDEATGLPWLESWASVYALVAGCFVTYVVLLVVLKQAFS